MLALCATAAVAATAPAENPVQRVTVPLSDAARPGALRVDLVHGSITVKGSNRKDVLGCVE